MFIWLVGWITLLLYRASILVRARSNFGACVVIPYHILRIIVLSITNSTMFWAYFFSPLQPRHHGSDSDLPWINVMLHISLSFLLAAHQRY